MSSTYQLININNRPPQLVDDDFYADIKYDNSDPTNVYIGLNTLYNISENDFSWKVFRLVYSSGVWQRASFVYGPWSNRTLLF